MARTMKRTCIRDFHQRDESSGLEMKLEEGKEYITTFEPDDEGMVRVFTSVWGWVPIEHFGKARRFT